MSFYLDTNAIYSFFFDDLHSARIERWLADQSERVHVGDWGKTEFYALVGRRLRGGGLTVDAAVLGVADFEAFLSNKAEALPLSATVGELATDLARDPRLKLSAADALHLACAGASGLILVSFDARLVEARGLGPILSRFHKRRVGGAGYIRDRPFPAARRNC